MNPAIMLRSFNAKFPLRRSFAQPFVNDPSVLVETATYMVKLQTTRHEYMKIQRLRYEVFHREFGKKRFPVGLDRDRYDEIADHLLVVEKSSNKIVGGYRLISSYDAEDFYSASEFRHQDLAKMPGLKVELSRACIHKNHRNGAVLNLLWKGVGAYCQKNGGDWLLGIPSIKTTDPEQTAKIYNYFNKKGYISEDVFVKPLNSHKLEGIEDEIMKISEQPLDKAAMKALKIPPLFLAYIKAGAKVMGLPAVDWQFRCVDFPVALNINNMSESYRRKFL